MKPKKKAATRRNAFTRDSISSGKIEEEETNAAETPDLERSNEYLTQSGTPLPKDLINAFKEVFDLFDSNGGGTIDAEELDLALRSVDIQLSQEEIIEVLTTMDRDGNGEIDFDEFLNLMTNTERFLEGFGDQDKTDGKYRRRETMLFEALTNFMKKSALHSIDEIVGFYHTKYRRAQAPHVVGHYAAGARLIGLTEFQLRKHMETLKAKHAAGDENSPYAEPLHIVFGHITKRKQKKKKSIIPPVRGRIRLRFNTTTCDFNNAFSQDQPMPIKKVTDTLKCRSSFPVPICLLPGRRFEVQVKQPPKKLMPPPCSGWKSQRIQPFPVELPVKHGRLSNIPGKLNSKVLSFDYLPAIKDKVGKAKEDFLERLYNRKKKESEEHWQTLQSDNIHSDVLRNKFRIAFNAYTQFLQIDYSRVQSEAETVKPREENQGRSKSVMDRKTNRSSRDERRRAKSTFQ